ncbi:hypothetical protein I4U23_020662 [Adineta vaga]|nr:hypothetical protein I4U23_020662 [Adineta vaga]
MLLPQAPPSSTAVSDKDQDGFNQLIIQDRHRQRQSYVQSYTAFETLRKRQDFVLRQENLRSLQKFIERMATKQDQFTDQSFYSYKQCFGKFINVRPSTHRNLVEQSQRPKTAGPTYHRNSTRQVLHIPATPFEPPPLAPFHRYQKSHRPSSSTRYRSNASSLRTPKSRQDPFRTTSFISHSQPFISFSESYLQRNINGSTTKSQVLRYNSGLDRSTNKFEMPSNYKSDSSKNRSTITRNQNGTRSPIKFQTTIDIDEDDDNIPMINDNNDQLVNQYPQETDQVDDFLQRDSPVTRFLDDDDEDDDDKNKEDKVTIEAPIVTQTTDRRPSTTPTTLKTDHVTKYNRPVTTESKYPTNPNINLVDDLKTSMSPNNRSAVASRLTNTPASTPEMTYKAALQDGLVKDKISEPNMTIQKPEVREERRLSQQSNTLTNDSRNKTTTQKRSKPVKKKHTIVVAVPVANTELITTPTGNDEPDSIENAMTVQNYASNNTTEENVQPKLKRRRVPTTPNTQAKKPSSAGRSSSANSKTENVKKKDEISTQMKTIVANEQVPSIVSNKVETIVPIVEIIPKENQQTQPVEETVKRTKKDAFETPGTVVTMTNAELKALGSHRSVTKKTRFNLGKEETRRKSEKLTTYEPETLELIEKIRHSEVGNEIGRISISKQGCRFELPSDLRKLEDLTPLEYIGHYCRFSSHRKYQFKRIFDKYRNSKYGLDISNLYSAITDIHPDSFTRSQYDELCRLICINDQTYQFSFETFSGILAVCERLVYDALNSSSDPEDYELAKDPLEKCDFDSLDRKFDGCNISNEMRKLLKTL